MCGVATHDVVWLSERAPVFQLVAQGEIPGPGHFAPLTIVQCHGCGHLHNHSYSRDAANRMYRGDVLSNVPVHVSMTRSLEAIANWIGPEWYAGKRVVEIGAGSGHLARILIRAARSVVVFEPSAGLRWESLGERVTLIPDVFSGSALESPADLIVCRQVLEHVVDPAAMLTEIRARLSEGGRVYLEVPRAEFIEERAALFDLHYAHVQYFHEVNLARLVARTGFEVERSWWLKEGHDVGLLLRPGVPRDGAPPSSCRVTSPSLRQRLDGRRRRGRRLLESLRGRVGLYGATWQGVAFLDVFQGDCSFSLVIDDNDDYVGRRLYCWRQAVPVVGRGSEALRSVDHVIITAYLHDKVIEARLREAGFSGDVLSVRADVGGDLGECS